MSSGWCQGEPGAIFGIVGQAVFLSRFLVQRIVSGRRQGAQITQAVWHLSPGGALRTFVCAIWRRDPVFSMARLFGFRVYTRKLMLLRASTQRGDAAATEA